MESCKDVRKALADFEEEIDCRGLTSSWNGFTMLVIIAGELIGLASARQAPSESIIELCSTAADELCPRMIELGSWEDFCSQLKERYSLVYHHRNFESNPSLSLQRKKAELVQQLADAIFVPV